MRSTISPSEDLVPTSTYSSAPARNAGPVLRGVNLYDLVWYSGYKPGTYQGQPQAGYDYLAGRGVRLIRLSFMWPQIQSELGGPLNQGFLRLLEQQVQRAGKSGIKVVLDLHNGCHFPEPNPTETNAHPKVCGNGVSSDNLNNVWLQLSKTFRGNPAVLAYDIMNEPNNMSTRVWQSYSQQTVNAVRAAGDKTQIWMEGTSYSGADNWERDQPQPWITDPANNIVYTPHQYFADSAYPDGYDIQDYRKFADRSIADLQRFIDWLAKYKVRGAIGEVGWPSSTESKTWQQWNALAERWYALADKARLPVTYFSATSAFNEPNSAYSAEHNGDGCGSGICAPPPIDTAHSQAQVIEKHPSMP